MYDNNDKIYIVQHAQGAWLIPERISTVYYDVQDYIEDEFEKSDYNTGDSADEQYFFSTYAIKEEKIDTLDAFFRDCNGTGFIITTEAVDYVKDCNLQIVRRDALSSLCKNDDEAAAKARNMGLELLDVNELPDKFAEIDERRILILDTKENRQALETIEKNIPLKYYKKSHSKLDMDR